MIIVSYLYLMLAIAFTLIACASLAVSQNRNWKNIAESPILPATQKLIRRIGWALLSIAFIICIARDGISFAILLWLLLIGISSLTIAMILSFKACLLKPFIRIYS